MARRFPSPSRQDGNSTKWASVRRKDGTITRTIYDGLNRVVSVWVGPNDTPASGYWSPTNNSSPANMVEVSANQYGGFGAMVAAVVSGSPPDSAGLTPGDVITGFAGHSIGSPAKLTSLVLGQKPGSRVSITYLDQGGAAHSTTVTLASGPPQ